MQSALTVETGFFLASITTGFVAAFLYDILRVSRRILGPGDVVVTIEDILFIASLAFIVFYAAYKKNNGEIRWHGFIGNALGIGLYAFIIRNRFLNLSTFLIKWLIKITEKILRFLFLPIRLIFLVFKKPISIIIWYTGRGVRRARRILNKNRARLGIRLKNTYYILRKK